MIDPARYCYLFHRFMIAAMHIAFLMSSQITLAQAPTLIKDTLVSGLISDLGNGNILWLDYDADGDMDIFIQGESDHTTGAYLYNNDGNMSYSEVSTNFPALMESEATWCDIDRDNDLDLFICGLREVNDSVFPYSSLYKYEDDTFVQTESGIQGVYSACAAWADYDNDGDPDLILSGATEDLNNGIIKSKCKLYINDGSGNFEGQTCGIRGAYNSNISISDFNKDMFPDVLITGEFYDDGGNHQAITHLYNNNHANGFSLVETGLPPLLSGDATFGDYDSDGFPDILLNGDPPSPTNLVYIFRNNTNGSFYDVGAEIIGAMDCTIDWADYDNDGDLDFLYTGMMFESSDIPVSQMYRNAGNNMFSNDHTQNLTGLMHASSCWGDADNDLDVDLIMAGYKDKFENDPLSAVYMNISIETNTAPYPPDEFEALVDDNSAILSWNNGNDMETHDIGLSYNIRIGTASGLGDIVSPMSLPGGKRMLHNFGNAYQNQSFNISDLSPGIYYWSVQSIDNSYIGSIFGEEQSFIILETGTEDYKAKNSIIKVYPIPAKDHINIEITTTTTGIADLYLRTTTGETVKELVNIPIENERKVITMNLSDLPSGIYVLQCLLNGQPHSKKIIIL